MARRRTRNQGKRVHRNLLIGQEGINIIEEVLLKMGYLWVPTGSLEAGIDGTIEIRDPETGVLSHSIIRVQSKATSRPFAGDDGNSFEFVCDERDLQYWLTGNVPVVIILSRTDTREAYWVSVKDYFCEPIRRHSLRIVFDKARDRFDVGAAKALRELAVPKDAGLYFSPPPKQEALVSNLLRVTDLPARLFHAITEHGSRDAVRNAFRGKGKFAPREFVAHGKTLLSVHDLGESTWSDIVDPGTVEEFEVSEWSETNDEQKKRNFSELLNQCLVERLARSRVQLHERRGYYYFSASANLKSHTIIYQSEKQMAKKEVFGSRFSKRDGSRIAYYRHSAFFGQFVRHDNVWYLEIVPTYHFTFNGRRTDRYRAEHLAGIKRLERNSSVLGQLRMWAFVLNSTGTLFDERYPHLRFGDLERFEISRGVNDTSWVKHEDEVPPTETEIEQLDSLSSVRLEVE